jgi:hypothetical protein
MGEGKGEREREQEDREGLTVKPGDNQQSS